MGEEVGPNAPTRTLDDGTPAPASADLATGARIGRYTIVSRIGSGGMGVVYDAVDESLGRRVAIKLLHPSRDPTDAARLVREARALAGLSHPNVVAIYEVGVDAVGTFLAMELVDGVPLTRWLATPRTRAQIAAVFEQAARGLAAAHRAGLVHRDVKPANILVGADRVRLADFGLARGSGTVESSGRGSAATDDRVTREGAIIGTPAYMAPEQRAGKPVDARADQYAFCVALAEALAGREPDADGPPKLPASVPAWLARVVARGLENDPAKRFPSMTVLADALARPRRAPWAIVASVGGLVAASGVIAVLALTGRGGDRDDPLPCTGTEQKLAGVWDTDAKARITAAFAKLPASHAATTGQAIGAQLDRYAADWAAMVRDTCEATRVRGDQSEALMDRRVACLDQRRGALGVLVRSLATIDARTLDSAANATRNLPRVADCADLAYVSSGPQTSRATQISEELMTARLHYVAARDREGLEAAVHALALARDSGDRAREVEALTLKGRLEIFIDGAAAVESLRAAVDLAGKIGATNLRIDAWGFLSQAYQRVGQMRVAADVLELAFAALREHPDRWRESELRFARGALLGRTGKYDEARAELEESLKIQIEIVGPDSQFLAYTYANLGIALKRLGRFEEALVQARRSLALAQQLGDNHQATVEARADIAILLGELGRTDEARAELERTIASARSVYGEAHEKVALFEDTLGSLLGDAGRWRDAHARFGAAYAIVERGNADAGNRLIIRSNLGTSTLMIGDAAEAERIQRAVLAEREKILPADHADLGDSHRRIGDALLAQGKHDAAAGEYAKAVAIHERTSGPDHPELARALLGLADAERARDKPARARVLGERALAIYEKALPAAHPNIAGACLALARDLVELREVALAAPLARRALAIFEARKDRRNGARARFALARTQTGDRARELALQARGELAHGDALIAEIDRFLQRDRSPR